MLEALIGGQQLRRVDRSFVGRLPKHFVRQHCVNAEMITRMITRKWIDDVSTPEQREAGEAIYRVTDAGRFAYVNRGR